MTRMRRWLLVAALLALAFAIAPRWREPDPHSLDLAPEERALHAVLAPFKGVIASWHWLAAGRAMLEEDPDAAYDHALELLRWAPHDAERAADLVQYFGIAAVLPLLQESPPRVELAFTLVQRAVELGEEALERGAAAEVLEVLRLVLTVLELDYHGSYGLDRRWVLAHGERPAQTLRRLLDGAAAR